MLKIGHFARFFLHFLSTDVNFAGVSGKVKPLCFNFFVK